MTQHEHWQHTGIIPAAEYVQDWDDGPEYCSRPRTRKAKIVAWCAAIASGTVVGAVLWSAL